ncbi:hypothetical protein [Microbacterium sp. Marseille-Q6965]|uniref:hypothetical protein n=1 Tax=Microbacterium sp. Marseille-Q6965 TaxID=2965072 RepID=UPI0021B7DB84|nr:hypothetical protein [Microbacterium sp. Marseille-Q6965]
MLWRRYRSAILLAVPAGAAFGAVLGVSFYLVANPDYRTQGGWGAFISLLASGAGIGGVTASAGLIGGVVFLLLADRHLRGPGQARVRGGAMSAAAAAALLWLIIGLVGAVSSSGGAAWFPWVVVSAAITAATTGGAAALILRRVERLAAS